MEAGEAPPGLGLLARRFGVGERRLRREFRAVFGVTPTEFISAWRATRFRDLLLSGVSVSEAVYGAGYVSSSRAYEAAERSLGLSPGLVRRGSGGERIEWGSAGSDLGVVTIGVSGRGICAVVLQPDAGWPSGVERLAGDVSARGVALRSDASGGFSGLCCGAGGASACGVVGVAAGHPRHGVSAPGLEVFTRDPCGRDAQLW